MNMFGFDKIKNLARDNLNKVVKSDFNTQRKSSDASDESYEEILLTENKKLKELIKGMLAEKDNQTEVAKNSQTQLRDAQDQVEDLKLRCLELASQKQILQMSQNFNGKFLYTK